MKRLFSILLCIVMMLSLLSGCSSGGGAAAGEETVAFTDSLGRTVQIPKELTRIAPSGSVATMILATIAPEYMVSVSATPSSAQYRYLPQNLLTLPTTGQMYGSKSTLNLETLLSCNAQLVIDLGDRKENMEQDLDALQKQIGIPVIFLEADVAHMEKMYRTLGSILSGKEVRGNELADFAAETVDMAAENSAKITDEERVRVMYTSGVSGLDTNADGSTQAQVLSLVGAENAVVVPEVSNRGGGNTINLEQLYNFDPDVIVFAAGSIYGTAAEGTTPLYGADLRGPAAIVIGSEGSGMGRLVRETCDFLVSIPMKGRISSLNASAAAAILLYEAVRQRQERAD